MAKARNKQYRPKPVTVPMMQSTRDGIALDLHLAVEALIHAPSKLTYDQLNRMVATLAIAGGELWERRLALVRMAETTTEIAAREALVHFLVLSDEDRAALRAGAGQVDDLLVGMCANKFKDALRRVKLGYALSQREG